ncbi:hypothetical protein [Candidatus Methanoprimaticola sp. MG2]|uniref:hypothetical protein n=1 Tax=Candidatus Methanoprimaticola sp. MG2 TaxID=3228838 RepID=UPI0039C7499C
MVAEEDLSESTVCVDDCPPIEEDCDDTSYVDSDIQSPFFDSERRLSLEKPLNLLVGVVIITLAVIMYGFSPISWWEAILVSCPGICILIPSVSHIDLPKEYDADSGFDFWYRGTDFEVLGARQDISMQFPMQISVIVTSVQKLGTIVGFGFLMITSYGVFIFSDQSHLYDPSVCVLIIMSFAMMAAGSVVGIRSLVSYKASPSTGANLYELMDSDWYEWGYQASRDNFMAKAFFESIRKDSELNIDIRWTVYLLSAALIPMMASAALCVIL